MSFVHYTLVGHFDPCAAGRRRLACSRPLDAELVSRLLAEYPPAVAARVTVCGDHVRCQWATGGDISDETMEFAYHLAREAGCVAIENGRQVMYPPEAARAQGAEWERVFGWVGYADEAEQRAREQAAELEERSRRTRRCT